MRISEALKLKMDHILRDEFIEVIGKMNIRRKVRVPNILKLWAQDYVAARSHKGEVEWAFASHNHFNE